jgi:hypothetical protein
MQAILVVHILAGTLSVLAGAGALVFRKGERAHRFAGAIFVGAMTIMATTAAVIGMKDPGNVIAGVLTIYFVGTAWLTVRRKEKSASLFEIAAFAVALLCALAGYWSAYLIASGAREAENPFILGASLTVSTAMAIAALGDLSLLLRRGVSGAQRIARHLWRMCFGLFIAVGSFMAQGADALPAFLPGAELLLASMLIVLLVMFYWLARVLFTRWAHTTDAVAQAAE